MLPLSLGRGAGGGEDLGAARPHAVPVPVPDRRRPAAAHPPAGQLLV